MPSNDPVQLDYAGPVLGTQRYSKLALASFFLPITGLLTSVMIPLMLHALIGVGTGDQNQFIVISTSIAGIPCSILAMWRIHRSNGYLIGRLMAFEGMLFGIFLLAPFACSLMSSSS